MRKRISIISSILSAVALLVSFGIGAAPASATLPHEKVDGIGNDEVGKFTCESVDNNICVNPSQFQIKKGTLTWIKYATLKSDDPKAEAKNSSATGNGFAINADSYKNGEYKFFVTYGGANKIYDFKFKINHPVPVVNITIITGDKGKKQLHITFADGTTKDIDLGDLKGEKGDKGDQGPQGPKGDKGDPGAPGKDGKDVKDALSGYNVYWLGGDYGVIFVNGKPAQGTDTPNFTVPSTITTNPVEVKTPQTQANVSESESAKQSQTNQSQENDSKTDEKSDSTQSADTETKTKVQLNKKYNHDLPATGVGVAAAAITMAVLAGVGVTLRKVRR